MEGLKRVYFLGKEREIFFGMPMVQYVIINIPTPTKERWIKNQFSIEDGGAVAHFIYAGLKGGCEFRGQAMDLGYEEIYLFADRMMYEGDEHNIIKAFTTAWTESSAVQWMHRQVKKKEAEVKSTGKKSEQKPLVS